MKKSFKIACIIIGAVAGISAGLASLNARKKKEEK
jgi:hypothetical protein